MLDVSINLSNETHFVSFFPLLQKKLTVLQIGSKNEKKKVIVYAGTVVVVVL